MIFTFKLSIIITLINYFLYDANKYFLDFNHKLKNYFNKFNENYREEVKRM